MKRFTMMTDQVGEGKRLDFTPRFTFDATNQKQADKRAQKWARYHSFSLDDVKAVISYGSQLNWEPHNEYVNDL